MVEQQQPLKLKTIVGQPRLATPILTSQIERIVVNPAWHVPKALARRSLLPKIIKDPSYLTRKRFTILSGWQKPVRVIDADKINWQTMTPRRFPYRLRQAPGAGNALGRLKFDFANNYTVFLHDTSEPRLFARHQRTFSSGCVRVDQSSALAEALFAQSGLPQSKLEQKLAKGKTRHVRLDQPIPVYLMYWTAWVDNNGQLAFRKDIYKRDQNWLRNA
jgi:murein L,D-transpeptidase YcbB/YkuD